jgi:hypothetical protein
VAATTKTYTQNRMGIPALWLFTRLSQLLWLIITLKAIYGMRGDQDFTEKSYFFGAIFVALSVALHPFSDGWVALDGIHCRRYFRCKIRRWEEIEAIQWVGSRLKTTLHGKSFLTGTFYFWLNPLEAVTQYRIQEHDGEQDPPAILKLIAGLPLDFPPRIVLGPLTNSGISMAFIAGFGSAMLIALVGLLHRLLQGH